MHRHNFTFPPQGLSSSQKISGDPRQQYVLLVTGFHTMLMYDLTCTVSTANYNGFIIPISFLKINYGVNRRTLSQSFFLNNQPDAPIIPILFCYKTLHFSGIFSAHHQEFSTVHSALVSFMQVFDDRFQAESEWSCVPS